jgi:putative FmdB family regulatory protein
MPIYEYQCKKCGETTEIMQKFSEPPLKACPACGGRVTKLMSMNSFQLKGSGWYVTDYSSRKGEAAPKAEGTAPKAESAVSEGTTPKTEQPAAKAVDAVPKADKSTTKTPPSKPRKAART